MEIKKKDDSLNLILDKCSPETKEAIQRLTTPTTFTNGALRESFINTLERASRRLNGQTQSPSDSIGDYNDGGYIDKSYSDTYKDNNYSDCNYSDHYIDAGYHDSSLSLKKPLTP